MMQAGWRMAAIVLLQFSASLTGMTNLGTAQDGIAVRTLDDPATGDRWVLQRVREYPGGPGRLIRMEGGAPKSSEAKTRVKEVVMIHAGDRVVVEEKTAMVEARLEGVALSAATSGGRLTVRLAVGGRLVRATAIAAGHAALAVEARR